MRKTFLIVSVVLLGLLCSLGPALAQGPPLYWETIYYNNFSTDPGWATTGAWGWGTYDGCCTDEAHSPGGMYGHGLGSSYGYDIPGDTLTTPALDLTGKQGVQVSVWMTWRIGSGDEVALEASNDGETWTQLWSQSGNSCNEWSQFTFDLSAVADNQPAVSLRWVLTSDSSDSCRDAGLDVDDLMISAVSETRPLSVIVWAPYSEDPQAASNIVGILWNQVPHISISYIPDSDCCDMFDALDSGAADVIVASTPDWNGTGGGGEPSLGAPAPLAEDPDMVCCGEYFGDDFREFVRTGGTVISCGEAAGASGFMRGTGLLDLQWASSFLDGYALSPAAGDRLLEGVSNPITTAYLTNGYAPIPGAETALTDPLGKTVAAHRDFGAGGAVVLGYSYDTFDDNAARVLVNAMTYHRDTRQILVYDTSNTHTAAEALNQLCLPYTTAGPEDFDTQLGAQNWDMVLVDNPAGGAQDWTGLLGYVEEGGRVAFSSSGLDLQPVLCAELGVSAAEVSTEIPPVHWTPEGSVYLSSIPELTTWNHNWPTSGYRLWANEAAEVVLAQYDAIPESRCQEALIAAHNGHTLLNGFLWDERNQDNDGDGLDDTVELVMVEIQHLTCLPKADFVGVPKAGGAPLEVAFTDLSTNFPTEGCWSFGDGATSSEQNPVHVYEAPGIYTVRHAVANGDGYDCIEKASYIELAAAAPVADFLATPTSGVVPLTVEFSDSTANLPTGWLWDFGDGSTSTAQGPSHEYTSPGSYTVTLTASNGLGTDTAEKAAYITVYPPAVGANFSANVTAGFAPLVVEFTDESTNAPTSWSWDFGDGTTSTRQHPIHVYGQVGYYTVSLTASNGGDSDTMERANYIVVSFADAASDNWAYDAIMACVGAGIVQGYGYEFRPEVEVKRDQMAVFFARGLAGGEEAIPTAPSVASFPDVPTTHWAFKHIEYLKDFDIVSGYESGLYHPEVEVNRGQMAIFCARTEAGGEAALSSYTPPSTSPFSDVATEAGVYKYVAYCHEAGIVNGYGDGTYHPEFVVTRDQMATFIARVFHLLP